MGADGFGSGSVEPAGRHDQGRSGQLALVPWVAHDDAVLRRTPQADPVIYRDEVRDILQPLQLLEETDGEQETPENGT